MNRKTEFERIGRRMPYKVPDGMFDELEREVLAATGCDRKPSHRFRTIALTVAAAASLALAVTFAWHRAQPQPRTGSLAEVQRAFAELDDADREFLSEIYDEDMFINH